jgi:hypothetical protein
VLSVQTVSFNFLSNLTTIVWERASPFHIRFPTVGLAARHFTLTSRQQ